MRVMDGDLCLPPSSKSRAMCLLPSTGYQTCMSWNAPGCLFKFIFTNQAPRGNDGPSTVVYKYIQLQGTPDGSSQESVGGN